MSRAKIRIGLLCDNHLFREGLRRILAVDPALTVAAAGEPAEISGCLRDTALDILLVGGLTETALRLCVELQRNGQRPYVLLLAADADDAWAVKALGCGARGILAKSAGADDLLKAIRVVHEGQIWVSRAVLVRVVERLVTLDGPAHVTQTVLAEQLTHREREIVRYVTAGLSNQEIADRLEISGATVKAHLTRIFQKLDVRDRAQLAALCHHTLVSIGRN